jgi:hypothetical protein
MIKTHDLPALLLYSGLKSKFDSQKESNMMLMQVNSLIMVQWNESIRYKPCGNIETSVVKTLLLLLEKKMDFYNGSKRISQKIGKVVF